jgi:hypothetical protein
MTPLGRMVEQARGTNYIQIVYSASGQKLALISGQSLQKAIVPLSGKALAVLVCPLALRPRSYDAFRRVVQPIGDFGE